MPSRPDAEREFRPKFRVFADSTTKVNTLGRLLVRTKDAHAPLVLFSDTVSPSLRGDFETIHAYVTRVNHSPYPASRPCQRRIYWVSSSSISLRWIMYMRRKSRLKQRPGSAATLCRIASTLYKQRYQTHCTGRISLLTLTLTSSLKKSAMTSS